MEYENDQNVIGKLMDEIQKRMAEKDDKIEKLEEENRELKTKMGKMKVYIKELKSSIRRRPLPSELLNILFASMPFENAFGLLAKMPKGLLARNVQKMINGIKESMKNNKLNVDDCGPNIIISEDGLLAKLSDVPLGFLDCVRAFMPIPAFNLNAIIKPKMAFYFEVKILETACGITFGFCDKQFPLENEELGVSYNSNSIGILRKHQICIDGRLISLGEDNNIGFLVKSDCIGLWHNPSAECENGSFCHLERRFAWESRIASKIC